MEEIFDNIFVRVGLWTLVIFVVAYSLIKWIIPFIIKKVKEKKTIRNDKKEYDLKENYNEVEIVTKDTKIADVQKQEMELSENLKEVDYMPDDNQGETQVNKKVVVERDEEFESFLREINKDNVSVKKQIKNASPKLKGIILSGVLQDKKF